MVSRRHLLAAVVVVLVASYLVAGLLPGPTAPPPSDATVEEDSLVRPADGGPLLWPSTSRQRAAEGRTLAINAIVHGPPGEVREALGGSGPVDPEPAQPAEEGTGETVGGRLLAWTRAHGADRYTLVDARPAGGERTWLAERYQLQSGTYLGRRSHIRAYAPERSNWTAIQVHAEYWDWLRLRHTVTDLQGARERIERDFIGAPSVTEVRRTYHGTDGSYHDGWTTEVVLAAVGLVGVTARSRRSRDWLRANRRGVALAGSVAAVVLGVRTAGIALESLAPALDPRTFAVALYPVTAAGPPLVARVLCGGDSGALGRLTRAVGPPLGPGVAFWAAGLGLAGGFLLEFGELGVAAVPVRLAAHRVGLAVALGLVAAGAARSGDRARTVLGIGLAAWAVGLAAALAGYV